MEHRWEPHARAAARIVFGFLILRHGLEQVAGYPEVSDAARSSLRGALELVALPGGALMMLGLFARPVGLVLSAAYVLYWVTGPLVATLTQGQPIFGNAPTDPLLLSAFLFLYVALAGAGPWSVDYLRDPRRALTPSPGAHYALGAMRIVAGVLFLPHGLEKIFGTRILDPMRQVAAVLETIGGPMIAIGLLTRATAFILSGEMAVAYFMVWAPLGFWASFSTFGQEAAILNSFLFLLISAAGPGAWSIDAWRAARRAEQVPHVEVRSRAF